jgi:hypothetical protein
VFCVHLSPQLQATGSFIIRMPRTTLISALAVAAACVAATSPNLASARLLSSYVESTGARCLDGSPQRYWIQLANESTAVPLEGLSAVDNNSKWYIHFMGGGWCTSVASCAARAYAPSCYIGSSNTSCFSWTVNGGNSIPNVTYESPILFDDIPSCLGARWCGGLMINDQDTNPLTSQWNKVLVPYCDGGSFAGKVILPLCINRSQLMNHVKSCR